MGNSQALVVDANVGGAANDPSLSPFAVACAAVLDAILQAGHSVAFDGKLTAEWAASATPWAANWWGSMLARGFAVSALAHNHPGLDGALADLPQNDRVPAQKDVHLVHLALGTGERIISNEKNSRRKFALLLVSVPELAGLHWVGCTDCDCCTWVANGVPHKPEYLLSSPPRW